MKDIFPSLIGNNPIKNVIGRGIVTGECSHAFILEGPEGSGKQTAARLIAAASSCDRRSEDGLPLPCGECDNCRRILKDISADVVKVETGDRATLGVDAIREIRRGLHVMPNDSDVRTYIIESADKMTVQAQNALLLSLEEPPSFVRFVLLVEDSAKLLETVRSRAQIIRMELFSFDETSEYLRKTKPGRDAEKYTPDRFRAAVSLSGGALGMAEALLEEKNENKALLKQRETAEKLVSSACAGSKSELLGMIGTELPRTCEDMKQIMFLADNAVRDIIASKKASSPTLVFFPNTDEAKKAGGRASLSRLMGIHCDICDTVGKLSANVSVKVAMSAFVLGL